MHTQKKIIREELIGKQVTATLKNGTEISGRIIDETKNTFHIKTNNEKKTIIKSQSTIKIKDQEIKGETLAKRPEDRIKIK